MTRGKASPVGDIRDSKSKPASLLHSLPPIPVFNDSTDPTLWIGQVERILTQAADHERLEAVNRCFAGNRVRWLLANPPTEWEEFLKAFKAFFIGEVENPLLRLINDVKQIETITKEAVGSWKLLSLEAELAEESAVRLVARNLNTNAFPPRNTAFAKTWIDLAIIASIPRIAQAVDPIHPVANVAATDHRSKAPSTYKCFGCNAWGEHWRDQCPVRPRVPRERRNANRPTPALYQQPYQTLPATPYGPYAPPRTPYGPYCMPPQAPYCMPSQMPQHMPSQAPQPFMQHNQPQVRSPAQPNALAAATTNEPSNNASQINTQFTYSRLQVELNGVKFEAIVDTGANVVIFSTEAAKQANIRVTKCSPI